MDIRDIHVGQTLHFQHKGEILTETVERINAKTIGMTGGWRVPPSLLSATPEGTVSPQQIRQQRLASADTTIPNGTKVRLSRELSGRWAGLKGTVIGRTPTKYTVETTLGSVRVPMDTVSRITEEV